MIPIGCWPLTTSDNSDVKWRQMENNARKLQWSRLYLQRYSKILLSASSIQVNERIPKHYKNVTFRFLMCI